MKTLWFLKWFFIFIINIQMVENFRILGLFPHPVGSHFRFSSPLMKGLASSGHNVTVLSYFPNKKPIPNYKDLPLTGLIPDIENFDLKNYGSEITFYSHFKEFFMLHEWGRQACEAILNSSAIQEVLGQPENSYDLIIMEQFSSDCLLGISYLLKLPVIAVSTCPLMPWHYERIGTPFISSHMPTLFVQANERMNFLQRFGNWFSFHGLNFMYKFITQKTTNELIQKYLGNSIPKVEDLVKTTSLFFVNQHYSLSGVKPLSPAVIELGGLHIQESQTLEMDIQNILDSAKNGVIYISWGSLIRSDSLPIDKRNSIINAVKRLDEIILWKWENDTLPNQPENVHTRKWMQQKEILCHPNVKLFWSHGGLMGSSETAYCGVPVLITPFYGDQFLNGAAFEYREMGKIFHYNDFNEESIYLILKELLKPKYQINAKKVSFSYRNRLRTPIETAVWWVEHVIRTNASLLTKSASIDIPWYEYYCFDMYGLILFILIGFISFCIYLIKKFCLIFMKQLKVKTN